MLRKHTATFKNILDCRKKLKHSSFSLHFFEGTAGLGVHLCTILLLHISPSSSLFLRQILPLSYSILIQKQESKFLKVYKSFKENVHRDSPFPLTFLTMAGAVSAVVTTNSKAKCLQESPSSSLPTIFRQRPKVSASCGLKYLGMASEMSIRILRQASSSWFSTDCTVTWKGKLKLIIISK